MNTAFKIEKGIAVPPQPTRSKYPFADMEVGDSFLIPGVASSAQISSCISYRRMRYAEKHRCARDGDGLRVWRIA